MSDVYVEVSGRIFRGWISASSGAWYPTIRAGELAEPDTTIFRRYLFGGRTK